MRPTSAVGSPRLPIERLVLPRVGASFDGRRSIHIEGRSMSRLRPFRRKHAVFTPVIGVGSKYIKPGRIGLHRIKFRLKGSDLVDHRVAGLQSPDFGVKQRPEEPGNMCALRGRMGRRPLIRGSIWLRTSVGAANSSAIGSPRSSAVNRSPLAGARACT